MSTLDLWLGIAVGVGTIIGLLIGVRLGKAAMRGEAAANLDRIVSLEAEIARLGAAVVDGTEKNQQLREQIARAEEREKAQEEKYVQMKADLDRAFSDLAAKALRENNESFLTLARGELGGQTKDAARTLEAKEQAIKNLVDPLGAALSKLDEQTRAMENKREGAYGEIKTLVEGIGKAIPDSVNALRGETSQLIAALRSPKTRGDWGQEQLRLCVEYAGMVKYCSFHEQVSTRDEDDQLLRPDLTVRLPNGRTVVVDAKTPSGLFSEIRETADPMLAKSLLVAHATRVKKHLGDLSSKAYWRQFEHSPEFVVCFLPSEALFSAALEGDPELIEFGSKLNVVLATPTTLIAMLKAINYGWQQMEITKNAKAIHEAGRKIYDKLVIAQGHVQKLGDALERGVDYYNKFLGTIEGRGGIFYHGRQLGELVHADHELEEIKTLPPGTRTMESQEWAQPLFAVAASDSGEEE